MSSTKPRNPVVGDWVRTYGRMAPQMLRERPFRGDPRFNETPLLREVVNAAVLDGSFTSWRSDSKQGALLGLRRLVAHDLFCERRAARGLTQETNLAFMLGAHDFDGSPDADDFRAIEGGLDYLGDEHDGELARAIAASTQWRTASRLLRGERRNDSHRPWIPMTRPERAWLFVTWRLLYGLGPQRLARQWHELATASGPPTWWSERYGAIASALWAERGDVLAPKPRPSDTGPIRYKVVVEVISDRNDPRIQRRQPGLPFPLLSALEENDKKRDPRLDKKTVQVALAKCLALTYRQLEPGGLRRLVVS